MKNDYSNEARYYLGNHDYNIELAMEEYMRDLDVEKEND